MIFDVVVLGSGLGGLQCAYILSREGYNVCLLEKNKQLGGCMQTFKRNDTVFDTGMHYIGSMDEGQALNKFFRYFKLSGKLNLRRMDENGYEIIRYEGNEYKFPMGYDLFIEKMSGYFPHERDALSKYIAKMKELRSTIDLYNMREKSNQQTRYFDYFSIGIDDFLNSLTSNQTLKNTLLGMTPLYAGVRNRTPMYTPMIIHTSYIESAYRFVHGGSQISDLLSGSIIGNGGTIMTKAEVTDFHFNSNTIKSVEINHSETIEGKYFISNINPKTMIKISPGIPLRPAYKKRIAGIEDTYGAFTLYLAMHKNAFEYINSNYYVYNTNNIWECSRYNQATWPKGYMLCMSPGSGNDKFTDSIIINTYMNWKDVSKWEHTTVEKRGDEYISFKKQKAEKLLEILEKDFPGIRSKIKAYYTSTPLTYRDYTGTSKGSMYGLLKDYNDPLKTMVLPRTHINNLLLTGQSINIHGVMGVTLGSILTCSELIGSQYLLKKMQNA